MTSSRIDKYSEKAISVESNLPPRRKTAAILTDSKGDYLSRHVTNIVETDILWWTKKGCTTERGAKWLVENFNKKKKDHGHLCIYVWLGTCDFTEKGRKYVSLRHNLEECFNNLTSNLKELSKFAETKKFNIVFLEIPYISITSYNKFYGHKAPEIFLEDDKKLQDIFSRVNELIVSLNIENSTHSPKFNCDLEKNRKNNKKRYNLNLYRDGIHPDAKLAKHWLRRISERVRKDCYYH